MMSSTTYRLLAIIVAGTMSACLQADTVTRFRADLTEGFVILEGGDIQGTGSTASGVAEFTLVQPDGNPGGTTMSYAIVFENVDLDGNQTPFPAIEDDIAALHIHDITTCSDLVQTCVEGVDTAGTVHLLNIYGNPRNGDDADVLVQPGASTITGLWDDGDASPGWDASPPGTPVPSLPISDPNVLDLLFSEQAAIFVHTNEFPTAAAGGLLRIVPEPSSVTYLLSLVPLLWLRRWQK